MTSEAPVDAVFLDDLIRTFQVGFRARPANVEVAGQQVEVAFDLELTGTHTFPDGQPPQGCLACRRALLALMEVAEWAVPVARRACSGTNGGWEQITQFTSGGQHEVVLAIRMLQRRRFAEAEDGWALRFLAEVREFLLSLGCHELAWGEAGPEAGIPAPETTTHLTAGL